MGALNVIFSPLSLLLYASKCTHRREPLIPEPEKKKKQHKKPLRRKARKKRKIKASAIETTHLKFTTIRGTKCIRSLNRYS